MNRRSLQLTLIVAVTLLAQVGAGGLPRLAPPVAHAATSFTWTGQGLDGHWNTAKNWSPNGVPGENGSGDSVTIGPAPGFSTSVSSVPQGVTLQDLTLAGHGTSLSGGSLTVTGSFDWSGDGALQTPLTVAGTASISDNGRKLIIAPATLTVAGTTSVSGTGLTLSGPAILTNTGTLTFQPGSSLSASSCCLSPAQLVNTGSVVVPSSLLEPQSVTLNWVAFNDQGAVSIGANSALSLQVAPSTFASGVSFTGGGTLRIENTAAVRLSGNVTLGSGTTFELDPTATLTGTATMRSAAGGGTFSWTGGTLAANLTVAAPVTGSISGPGRKVLDASFGPGTGRLTLSGPSTLSGAAILNGAAILTNTGTLTLQPGALISASSCCVFPAQLVNTGTVVVPAPPLSSQITTINGVAFNDRGTVSIGPNSALELQIAPSTFASGVSFSGGGTFHIDDQATVRLSGNVTLGGGTTFDLGLDQNNSAGVLTGTATLRGAAGGGTFSWTGGTLSANLTVAAPVTGSISGPGRKVLDASFGPGSGRLTLSGPSTLSGAAILNGAAILTNTGTLTLQPGAGLSSPVCCVHPAQFVNTGTLSSTVGASNTATLSSVAWTNSGTVDLRSGTVAFGGPNYTQTKGTTKLDGGALAVATGTPLVDLQGGSLTGQGVITASLSNAALVDPGRSASTPGQITIIGNYNQTNKGKLRVDLKGSTTPGTDYDQLAVKGTASLTGTLDFETTPGFTPTGSDSFAVVTSTTRTPTSRQFTTLTSSSAQAAQYWVQYQPTAAVLALTGMRWGVDSADTITSTFYSTVKQTYGTPAFWARYIGDPNTSFNVQHGCNQVSDQSYQWKNITAADVAAARNDGFDLLPVYFNYPKTAVTGATCGQNYAKAAIEFAQHWTGSAIPQGTAIFVDIEFDASTDAAFLKGWYDEFNTTFPYTSPYDGQAYTYQAGYYKAGYYGDTGTNATITNFDSAYCAAVSQEPAIGTNSFIWTIRPGLSRTTKTAAPAYYRVIQPPCGSQTVAWQYGLNDPPTPPDVDTDEAVAGLPLWHP